MTLLASSLARLLRGVIPYGQQTATGGHDHRGSVGNDRTPAQKRGDAARRGPRSPRR